MTFTLFLIEFRQACAEKGCPFCALAQKATRRYLSNLLYEYTLAPDIHQRLAASHGFCNAHAWLLQYVAHSEQKDGMGVALFYGNILKRVQNDLEACLTQFKPNGRQPGRAGGHSALAAASKARLQAQEICLACAHQADNERFTISQILDHVLEEGKDSELARRYAQSAGACMHHFLTLLEHAPNDEIARWLMEIQREKTLLLIEQLEEYVRKHDVRYKHLPMGPEKDSWVRAIEQMIGKGDVPISRTEPR